MKLKKGAAQAKGQLNGVQNGSQVKKQKMAVTGAAAAPKKAKAAIDKKLGKPPVKMVPPKNVEEEEEDDELEEEGTEGDSGADVAADVAEEEGDSDEDDDDDDDDEEDDEGDEDESMAEPNLGAGEDADEDEDDDDDEAPAESPILKKQTTGGVPKINTGTVPNTIPVEQVLIVQNLPKKFKQIDIVQVFAKYGDIHTIHPVHGEKSSTAFVAFSTAEAAKTAAEATNNKAKVRNAIISVTVQTSNTKKVTPEKKAKKSEEKQKKAEEKLKNAEEHKRQIEMCRDRTVYVKNLKPNTTEEQVREHFEGCGGIQSVKVLTRNRFAFAFVTFEDIDAVKAAKQLHNSVLNDANLGVFLKDESQQQKEAEKDPKRTVTVKNTQNLESCPGEKLTTIFSKCGEIEDINILCKKNVLAFVTFKAEKGAKKAILLSGTNAQGLELEVEEYKIPTAKPKTAVFVQNVKPGVTEEEIRELFSTAGALESVFIKGGFAIVKFQDTDGFCKSFLLNESLLQGQMIFMEPYSEKKQTVLKHSQKPQQGRKRPYNGNNNNKAGGNRKKFKQY